jgi:hypothetical protein
VLSTLGPADWICGARIARAGQLVLLHEQLLTCGLPLLRRHDRRAVDGRIASVTMPNLIA